MQPSTQIPIITNPYVAHQGFSAVETQALVACALMMAVLGLLLAQQHVLARIASAVERTLMVKGPLTTRAL